MPRPRFNKLDPEKRKTILRVAGEEFAEHGFQAASINRIVARSGTNKGAIYYYFDDKEDLFRTVLGDCLSRFLQHLGAPDPGPIASPEDFWQAVARVYVRVMGFWKDNRYITVLVRTVARASQPPAAAPIEELRSMARGYISQFVQLGQRVGALRSDVDSELVLDLGLAVLETIDLWVMRQMELRPLEELEEIVPSMVVDLLRRMAAPEDDKAQHGG